MSEAARAARAELEARLGSRSPSDIDAGTILVVPSLTFPEVELRKIVGIEHYEERLLFFLLLLQRPGIRVVYVTSTDVDPAVVDYYLSFVDDASARERLTLVPADDPTPRALSEKLLERSDVCERIASATGSSGETYMLTFNVTAAETELADQLGVLLYGPHRDVWHLGSKSGSRWVARRAGVDVPEGRENVRSLAQLRSELGRLARAGKSSAAVVKLNEGFSGQGNAIVSLAGGETALTDAATTFGASEESWSSFATKIEAGGAIVEELIEGRSVSPSVQMRVQPDGSVEVVSTHEQILGDPDQQVYLGCRFPADATYRAAITDRALRIGKVLSEEGVVGSFGIDFVVVEEPEPAIYLSEINLRLGGTTHPFLMARLATGGHLDADSGELLVDGRPRYYSASDNLKSDAYVGLTPEDVLSALDREALSFDRSSRIGVLPHLLGALPRYGKLGATCVGSSADEADDLLMRFTALLDRLGAESSRS